ncbi:MAG: Veg family protein [Eggerthellales bacterium]|nr:Veg family protein [Eggerthellales bacterium]
MDLEKQVNLIGSIHDTLNDFVGQRLKVRANMGRSKIVENEGVLKQVHPSLFIMEVDRKRGRTARQSYQYVDVLTGMVELSHDGESLFEPLMLELNGKPADEAELVDQEA